MKIEEETAERLVLRFDAGPGRQIALWIGGVLVAVGLALPLLLGWTPEGQSGLILVMMGALPLYIAIFKLADFRTEFDQASGFVTAERRPTIGTPVREVLPLGEVLGADTALPPDNTPRWMKQRHRDRRLFEDGGTGKRGVEVGIKMSRRSGGKRVVISPPYDRQKARAVVAKIRDWLPHRPNEND